MCQACRHELFGGAAALPTRFSLPCSSLCEFLSISSVPTTLSPLCLCVCAPPSYVACFLPLTLVCSSVRRCVTRCHSLALSLGFLLLSSCSAEANSQHEHIWPASLGFGALCLCVFVFVCVFSLCFSVSRARANSLSRALSLPPLPPPLLSPSLEHSLSLARSVAIARSLALCVSCSLCVGVWLCVCNFVRMSVRASVRVHVCAYILFPLSKPTVGRDSMGCMQKL
jgi:hypothetical protein